MGESMYYLNVVNGNDNINHDCIPFIVLKVIDKTVKWHKNSDLVIIYSPTSSIVQCVLSISPSSRHFLPVSPFIFSFCFTFYPYYLRVTSNSRQSFPISPFDVVFTISTILSTIYFQSYIQSSIDWHGKRQRLKTPKQKTQWEIGEEKNVVQLFLTRPPILSIVDWARGWIERWNKRDRGSRWEKKRDRKRERGRGGETETEGVRKRRKS